MLPLRQRLRDDFGLSDEALFLGSENGEFDTAILGVIDKGEHVVLLYDEAAVIECLMMQGMSDEDAWDWYGYNISSAYLGPTTPVYCRTLKE